MFRLEVSIRENQDFEARNAALQAKLKSVSAEKVSVSLQLGEIRITLQNVESQNSQLQEMVNELQHEVDQVGLRLNFLNPEKQEFELYNLKNDPFEKNNLALKYPLLVKELQMMLDEEHESYKHNY